MENATKALLIAGAVLLVIMIISVGLMIFNSANEQVTGAISSMNQQAKDQFNNKFLGYEGRQNGSTVKTLVATVNSHNLQMEDEGTPEKGVYIAWDSTITVTDATAPTTADKSQVQGFSVLDKLRNAIKSGSRYDVTTTLNSTTGLIEMINLKKISGSSGD